MLEGGIRQRFESKFDQRGPDECWPWKGARNSDCYGNFALDASRANRVFRSAHRVSYEHFIGPIPDGLHLDHLCRNPSCVNPAHLEPVTNRMNSRRGARGVLVTHCRKGHEYTPENTGWHARPTGARRYCKTCSREQRRAAYVPKPPRTHCKRGHEYAAVGRNGRGCAECARERWRAWKAAHVAAGTWRW